MHGIVHVEIPVTNLKRAQDWYGKVFGWTFMDSTDPRFQPSTVYGKDNALWNPPGGGTGGALFLVKKMPAKSNVRAYIEVESIDMKLKEIKAARGKVLVPKTEVLTFGWWAEFNDPQGCVPLPVAERTQATTLTGQRAGRWTLAIADQDVSLVDHSHCASCYLDPDRTPLLDWHRALRHPSGS